MSAKKGSVKWNIPDVKDSRSPRTPRSARSHAESASEKYAYTDTFEDPSISQAYSDTFVGDSYSDTFVNGSSGTVNGNEYGTSKLTLKKNYSATSDNIQTVMSMMDRAETSEIFEETNAETAKTDVLETVIEVDLSVSDFAATAIETRISDTVRTVQDTAIETAYDISDTHPPDSYSYTYTDTFDSSGRTKADSEYETDSYTESQRSHSTGSSSQRSRSFTDQTGSLTLSDDDNLDRSFIAPDHDGKSLTDDEDETEDYSYTFEPTEISSMVHLVDPEEVRREAEEAMISEEAEKDFVQRMMDKLKYNTNKSTVKLEILPADSDEESEDDHLKYYCKKKIKLIKRKKKYKPGETDDSKPHPLAHRPTKLLDYGVPDSVLERAKLTNVMSAMHKAAKEEIHEPNKCPECREVKLRLDTEEAERLFVLSRARMLKNKMMDVRVEDHLLKMNSVSMIAELARELPRHSEKPEKVLDQLLEPLLGKNVMR